MWLHNVGMVAALHFCGDPIVLGQSFDTSFKTGGTLFATKNLGPDVNYPADVLDRYLYSVEVNHSIYNVLQYAR